MENGPIPCPIADMILYFIQQNKKSDIRRHAALSMTGQTKDL
jgi:hypothetical protein